MSECDQYGGYPHIMMPLPPQISGKFRTFEQYPECKNLPDNSKTLNIKEIGKDQRRDEEIR